MVKGRSHEERPEEQRGLTKAEQAAIKEQAELWQEQQAAKAAKEEENKK